MRGNNKRKNKRIREEREIWETPEELFGIGSIRTTECDDEERPEGVGGNPSHLLLGTEELLHRQAGRSLDFVGEVLGIEAEGPWRWQRPFYLSLLRLFFDESSDAPAWITIVPFRMPHELRFAGRKVTTQERRKTPSIVAPSVGLKHAKLPLDLGLGEIDTDDLLLAYPKVDAKSQPYVIRQWRERKLAGRTDGQSLDSLVYIADPGSDRGKIEQAHVPAMGPYFDPALGMLKTASLTLAKTSSAEECDVAQLIVTMQPEDGWTVALTPGFRSLRTYCAQYPIDQSLLTRGTRR